MSEFQPNPTQVAAWLREHPDFLAGQPELLAELRVPHEAGAASLIEHQLEVLRRDNEALKRRLTHLSRVAGQNERLLLRLHKLTLSLVAAETVETMVHRLDAGLHDEFEADRARLLLDAKSRPAGLDHPMVGHLPADRPDWLTELIGVQRPLCGRLTREKRATLLGADGETLGSVAVLPLGADALLAIGATADDRFHPEMGTLFLELLTAALRFRLDPSGRVTPARAVRA